ncbi:MAG TPA: enterotoxin, partial [Fimbriimonadaceae bacterium]|nr:enterotoxin [Fimbriimonadaceae bacterium]
HYNSWYDIGFGNTFDQAQCIDRIDKFGQELVKKRGVQMSSFLFDDGWDNYQSIWQFNSGFPNGFIPLRNEAEKFNAAPGVWLSPWGGYSSAREARLKYGKAHGMEVDSQGYALSGPKYYKKFHDVTLDFVTRQGINQFKFDGTGSPDKTTPGSQFDSDFEAAISLIGDLRAARPDLFVNLTTGTWPSPFWLKFADSTWRGGADHSFAGVGTWRQKWMTYRDGDTYHGVVQRGPLYPINSLMVHGLIYAQHAQHLNDDPGNDFRDDAHDYFANGTQLQEMYITPDLLTQQNWDDLAEAAKWSRVNADVLVDTHWVGGDPTKLEVYGWGAWCPRKAILTLRNPSEKPQAFSVDVASVLQVPSGFAKAYSGTSPWRADERQPAVRFPVGESVVIDLKPFEVRTFDLAAEK